MILVVECGSRQLHLTLPWYTTALQYVFAPILDASAVYENEGEGKEELEELLNAFSRVAGALAALYAGE
jgi:hypothetical protein